MLGQRPDVLGPLAQRRQLDRKDTEPMVEIEAESARLGFGRQIAAGGGDKPRGQGAWVVLAQSFESAMAQDTQQSVLESERKSSNLVEEQCAPFGQLQASHPLGNGAAEGAASVAEKLAFDEVPRERSAIHAHQRPASAVAKLVNGAGHQVFARAGL